ncbi:BlaI/MecI/CopY family transcriptional regulator [Microlunatus aurantiacus]|jgi:predicted transcriptional regulator|uniref:BlaI/MecI/CopY family transcriptional regulator n=1 Tax=Microlunatus aurantiacus TaxID=446786 RepID=A0ABP7E4G0_9ACTN|nr:BlaI/MecI/CopY family transcriptional regulator [Microlunatus sp.]
MRRLGQLEAAVMAHLWDADTWVSVREVVEDLRSGRTIAYTTVLTVLDNLHAKGFVDRIKDGRAFRYSARASREAHAAALMEEALADTPDRAAALLHFVEHIPAEDLDRLRAALDAAERRT